MRRRSVQARQVFPPFSGLSLAVVLAVATAGCDDKKPPAPAAEAAKQASPAAPKAAPGKMQINPHETPQARAAQKPMLRSQEGKFDLTVGGKTEHLPHLPFGQNAAVHFEGKKGRITVSGASADGYPRFTVTMIGWQLDKLELPLKLTSSDKQLVRFLYEVGERGDYKSDDEATKRGENTITLESYVGDVLTGSFNGTVARKSGDAGEPLPVSGTFSTALRLRGVQKSGAAADTPASKTAPTDATPTEAPAAKTAPAKAQPTTPKP